MPTPGELLRATRERKGLSQRALAELAGTRQAQISRIERDIGSPAVATLAHLLGVMGEELILDSRRSDSR